MKKGIFLLLLFFSFFLKAQSQTTNASFMHNGVQRDYVLHIPANYTSSQAVPLILNFHGFGGNGSNQLATSNFKAISDTAGFIVVSPTGTPLPPVNLNHWNVGGWTSTSTTDDIGFTSDLIDTLAAQYNVDLTRVYATGFSNGGFFSHRLACELSHRIAAIASVSGTFTPLMQANCNPSHPTPVLQIHGTTDAVVPYNGTTGNGGMAAVDTVLDYWVTYNNCSATPSVTALPDINTSDGSTVEHIVYNGGDNGVKVEHFKVNGGDHNWPGASGNMDIDASVEIWKFFSQYSNTPLDAARVNKKQFTLSPNPVLHQLRVQLPDEHAYTYRLFNTMGQIVRTGSLANNKNRIGLSDLQSGLYILQIDHQTFKVFKD